jgi:alpha-ketoglutarate-dependent taurine dioxygenase
MKTVQLNNAIEVQNIDLMDDTECVELGHIVAEKSVVLVRQVIPEIRLHQIHSLWGQPASNIVTRYVGEKRLTGRHWRSLLVNMSRILQSTDKVAHPFGLMRVSFNKNEKGKPVGFFANGNLDWHCDQQAYFDNQTVVGLMSLWGSENSQTSFLCTANAYSKLSSDDRSMVDELVSVWKWDGGSMSEDLISQQMEIVRYNMVPHSNMECPLLNETAAGIKGIKFPSHCFSHFKGMSKSESEKFKSHLWDIIHKPEYVYTHDWQDGEVIFMDQNITLHARPTNIEDGNMRTMARMTSYMDHIYPDKGPLDYVMCGNEKYDHDTFATMVDQERRQEFYA